MQNKKINKQKVMIGGGLLFVLFSFWPLVVDKFVITPKVDQEVEKFASKGIALAIQNDEGYFYNTKEYHLTVVDREKFIPYLSELVKIDKELLFSIMPQKDDVIGLQFSGVISAKIWKPFNIEVYIEPKEFPKNQTKLLEYKDILKKFGGAFIFNLQGKLKEIDINDLDITTNEQDGTKLIANLIKPVVKIGETNKFVLEKYLVESRQEDKNVALSSNHPIYNFHYKDDYNFKLTSTADDLLYYTKYNLTNPDDYTIYLAKRIANDAKECKNIRCIKTIAHALLENEKHINSFEIYLGSRIVDGIRYNKDKEQVFEIRHQDNENNLEYRITYAKDNFALPNVELKSGKNSTNIEAISDNNELSFITNTKVDQFSLQTHDSKIEAKTVQINGGLEKVLLEPIKFIMDNTDQLALWEEEGYSPLLQYVIDIANHGGEIKYGMEFSELHYSPFDFLIKSLKLDANFVLKQNKYNILHNSNELLKYVTFHLMVRIDKDSFNSYLKSPTNDYKNLDKVAKYDGDYVLLDIDFNLKNDQILVNQKKLIK